MLSKGVGLFPTEPVGKLRHYTLLAEELGYDNVWFGDSQNIWREASITMGAAAVGTERVVFGTGVTNAVTRHRSLLASTWATLWEYTGGRAPIARFEAGLAGVADGAKDAFYAGNFARLFAAG